MINARARAIDSVILFFHRIYLNGEKISAFCSSGFITIIA